VEKRTTKEIADKIRAGSELVYNSEAYHKQASFIKPLNIDQVEYAVSHNSFDYVDFYLMQLVYEAGFITPEILFQRIEVGKERGEKSCKVISDEGLLESVNILEKRLRRLASSGFMFCYEQHLCKKGTKLFYYSSMEGFRAFTHRLEIRRTYNRTIVFRPEHDIYRFLAANTVLYTLCKNPSCVKFWGIERFELPEEKMQEDVYGRLKFEFGDGITRYLLLEPAFFRCNEKVMSMEESRQHVIDRIEVLKKITAEFDKSDNTETYTLFIVENGVGVSKLQKIIEEQDVRFFIERCYFTSENAIADSYRDGGDGLDSILGIGFKENALIFKLKPFPLNKGR